MRPRYHWALLALALAAGATVGQEKGDKSEKNDSRGKTDPGAIEVRFADDSTVKMVLLHNSIEVTTRYGKLTVPVSELRRIEFGLRIPEDTAKKIASAVARLGSREFKQRDAAAAELLALREAAYPALQQAAKSSDAEVSRRARETLKVLTETVPAEKLHLPKHDTIVATDFTIIGRVEAPVLKARTPYFGETSLNLADVRGMRLLGNDRESTVSVDAARYGGQNETWMDTGVDVRAGTGLQIAASGSVDLMPAPGEAGTRVVSPDGMSRRTAREDRVGFPGGGPGGGRMPVRGGGTNFPGALLGRIGESGRVFVVGSRFEGDTGEEGRLYLRIAPSPYSTESSGTYNVRVKTAP